MKCVWSLIPIVLLWGFASCSSVKGNLTDEGAPDPQVDTSTANPLLSDIQAAQDQNVAFDEVESSDTPEVHLDVAPDASPTEVRIDDFAEALRVSNDFPGVAVLAFDLDGVLARGVAGVRKFDEEGLMTDEDKFHLGSCTKAMTSTLVARLVERGELSFNSTLKELFPAIDVHEQLEEVTMAQLLRHESGLYTSIGAQNPELWQSLWAAGASNVKETRQSFAQSVLTEVPPHNIGSYNYSNTGYMIAGAALELITGLSWEEMITEELFEPLAMKGCGFGFAATVGTVDQPWGHMKKANGAIQAIPPGPQADNPAALGPAGTVHCPLESWSKYLVGHLGGGPEGYLKPETWTTLHTAYPPSSYSMGWLLAGGNALTHFGSNNMNVAGTWLLKEANTGFIIVTNVGPANAVVGPVNERFPDFFELVLTSE